MSRARQSRVPPGYHIRQHRPREASLEFTPLSAKALSWGTSLVQLVELMTLGLGVVS